MPVTARTRSRLHASLLLAAAAAALPACTTYQQQQPTSAQAAQAAAAERVLERVQILALNDFHGNLEVPQAPTVWHDGPHRHEMPLGGAAELGAMLASLRQGQDHTITVAAGDMIGATPLISAYFLDEPTIMALNRMGMDLVAVGNHEFDRGVAELVRMQQGGCEQWTDRQPCLVDQPFEGANFSFLAANVLDDAGTTLFPASAMRQLGAVRLGFIGMTLKETATLVSPSGIRGYRFADEAETANRHADALLEAGADAVVLLIHQGGSVNPRNNIASCPELSGAIVPILQQLDPRIQLVISGHTHAAYICESDAGDGRTRWLTSAGQYGAFITDIRLDIDRHSGTIAALEAINRPVQGTAGQQAEVAAVVSRYAAASREISGRVAGRISGDTDWPAGAIDSPLANLVADAQLAATSQPGRGAAQLALMNSGGIRASLLPADDGTVTYGQLFAVQPFGNTLVVLEMTGAQLQAVLEQQFTADDPAEMRRARLLPSASFSYGFDRARPVGSRIADMRLNGQPIDPSASYRITVNSFLASGGDGYNSLAQGRVIWDGMPDIDALEDWIAAGTEMPATGRIKDMTGTGS